MNKNSETKHTLDNGIEIIFITERLRTICVCEQVGYDRVILRHKKSKTPLYKLHEQAKHLFPQYIIDVQRYL